MFYEKVFRTGTWTSKRCLANLRNRRSVGTNGASKRKTRPHLFGSTQQKVNQAMSKKRLLSRALLLGCLNAATTTGLGLSLLATTSCGASGPSAVGQGAKYSTGNQRFDEFFTKLHELQLEMAGAPKREKEIRAALSKELGGDPDASPRLLAKRVEKKAKELADAGTGLKLVTSDPSSTDEPSAEISSAGVALDGAGTNFAASIKTATIAELKLAKRMKVARRQLEAMRAESMVLDTEVDATFRLEGPGKKGEVRKNLQDARTLIPLMTGRADEVFEKARQTVAQLKEACNTDDGSFSAPPPPPETPPEGENGESGGGESSGSGSGGESSGSGGGGESSGSGSGGGGESSGSGSGGESSGGGGDFEP